MTTASILPSSFGGVLVASPSISVREQVRRSLYHGSCPVQEVSGGADALVKLESGHWQLLFLDRRLPDLDAEELIQIIKVRFPGIEVVIVDSDGGPIAPLKQVTSHSVVQACVQLQTRTDNAARNQVPALPGMIGDSEEMQQLYRLTRLVAPRNTTVLITGDTGTGKELVARAIHQLSSRCSGPWVVVNCAAIPEALLESELFGYARGAFTGAAQAHSGRIHAAQGGTLFLDEIGELPLGLQSKLLRFLEQKEVQRLGAADTVRVDVRVVAATNRDLQQQVEPGNFRHDLYYRLSAFPLFLPPLAKRKQDILPLARHFLRQSAETSKSAPVLSLPVASLLEDYAWPGNVRELQQVLERAVILGEDSRQILPEHLYFSAAGRTWAPLEKTAHSRAV